MLSQHEEIKWTCVGMLNSKPVSCPEQQQIHSAKKSMVNHDRPQGKLVRKKDSPFPVTSTKQHTLNLELRSQEHICDENQHSNLRPWKIPGHMQASSNYYCKNTYEQGPGLTGPLFP